MQKGFLHQSVEAVLDMLIQQGFLNEQRFCEAFIQKRIRQGYGPIRISAECHQYGINNEIIFSQLPQDEELCMAQLTITWFLVGYAIGQLLYGPLANRLGRKSSLYTGIGIQIVSSFLCILAGLIHNFFLLVSARFFLAIGSGVGLTIAFTLTNESFTPKIAQQKTAYLLIVLFIMPGLSIALGGLLNHYDGWMSCIYAGAVYGLVLLFLTTRLTETSIPNPKALKFKNLIQTYFKQLQNSALIVSGLLMGGAISFIYIFTTLAPYIAIGSLGMNSGKFGIASILPSIGSVIGTIISAQLAKKYSNQYGIRLARFFLAIGSGVGLTIAFTLTNESFTPKIAQQKTAYLLIVLFIMPGLSIALGGLLNHYDGWMSCIYAGAVYGLVLLFLTTRLTETSIPNPKALKFKNLIQTYFKQLQNSALIVSGLLMGGAISFIYIFTTLAPYIAIGSLGMNSGKFGIASILPSIGSVIGTIISAQLAKKYSNQYLNMPATLPQFNKIDPTTIVSKLDKILTENKILLAQLLAEIIPLDWSFIQQLDDLNDRLQHFWSPINHLYAVKQTPELRYVYNECLPKLSAYTSELSQNQALYQSIKNLANSDYQFNYAQEKCLHNELRDFHLGGVDLPEIQQKRYQDIQTQLSQLSNQFEENLLDATTEWSKCISNKFELKGVPAHVVINAEKAAQEKDLIATLPQFNKIDPTTIVSKLDKILTENKILLAQLLAEIIPLDWSFIQQLDDLNDRLQHFWSPINHLYAVKQTPELRYVYNECLPKLSAYTSELSQNQALYQSIKNLANSDYQFNYAQEKCLHNELRDFHLGGVDLPEIQQKRYQDIQTQLSQLSNQFEENLLDATTEWSKCISNKFELKGVPAHVVINAEKAAQEKDLIGYLITLDYPTYFPIITYADNRDLRETIYKRLISYTK
ncbi:hypothetical protein FQR65_LT14114 [Abscondita terminalis]|nr:hypothetical protein FQR65_LT14114 [Abscondita terminalis]